jgi:hypothetical protein
MSGLLREPLSAEQMHLLQVIYEQFDQSGAWPIWQYVDLTLDTKYQADAADVLASLPWIGERGTTSQRYGLTWREDSHLAVPNPDQHVVLTVAGLRYLRLTTEPVLGAFLVTIRHLVEAQRRLVPSPTTVVEAAVPSGEIAEQLTTWSIRGVSAPPAEATMRKVRRLLKHEPFLYNVVQQPKPDIEEWTVRVPAALRAYRGISSIDDYLHRLVEQVAPPELPPVPLSARPLDIPNSVGYLDAVWTSKTASRLFVNLDPHSVVRLTQPCGNEEDFNSLMSALADVLGQVVTPGRAAPHQRGALEGVRDYLVPLLEDEAAERVTDAFATLIRLRHIRVAAQHSDARHKAVAAFRDLGLPFPPVSWNWAWAHVASMTTGALDALREEVHVGLLQS